MSEIKFKDHIDKPEELSEFDLDALLVAYSVIEYSLGKNEVPDAKLLDGMAKIKKAIAENHLEELIHRV